MKICAINLIKPSIKPLKPAPISFKGDYRADSFEHEKNKKYYRYLKFIGKGLNPRHAEALAVLLNKDIALLSLSKKEELYQKLIEIKNCKKYSDEVLQKADIDGLLADLKKYMDKPITPTEVDKKDATAALQGFFANKADLETTLKNFDFAQYQKNGLPLKYSRKAFLRDLTNITSKLPFVEQEKIFQKLEIKPIRSQKISNIVGYDGIINLSNLDKKGAEKEIYDIAHRFIRENEVQTGNDKLDEMLNSLIKGFPEFINIIGKQQHLTHDLSLDIHILSVLKEVLNNPKYQQLSPKDKFCLKIATTFHDIAKKEATIDSGHEETCAKFTKEILNKKSLNLPVEYKNRIFEFIKNHNWLQKYNTGAITAEDLAVIFRRKNDYTMAQIFAEADLKGVQTSGRFYHIYGSKIKESEADFLSYQQKINSAAHIILTNSIINPAKVPVVEHKGEKYKVVNFTKLDESFNLEQYGFEPNTTVENLRLLVNVGNSFEDVAQLSDSSKQGFICSSFISPKNAKTYCELPYGVSLRAENINIANASTKNQGSGFLKNFSSFKDILKGQLFRHIIPAKIRTKLALSPTEYAKLYEEIQKYSHSSQLNNIDDITINSSTLRGREIKNAISEANDLLLTSTLGCNEVNIYSPKINAVIAKEDKLDKVPAHILKFARKHDLPIFLFGR